MPDIQVTTKKVWLPLRNHSAVLLDREAMKVGHPAEKMHKPTKPLPTPKLPIDWAKSFSFPILGNNIYGDCMIVAAQHGDNTFTANVGSESNFNADATVAWYLKESGGDNGLNDGQVISDWLTGLPSVPAAKIMDSLSIDTTDAELVQQAIWLFGGVHFGLSIPDAWYNNFTTGYVWDAPATADAKNGHGVWWNGVNAQGHYRLETWGTYGWITPAGVADCNPSGFTVFSLRWFDGKGIAPNGYSYAQLADYWKQMGGKTLPVWPEKPTKGDRLLPGQGLLAANSITSADGRFELIMQTDGNLVIYGPQHQPVWASNTSGHADVFDVIFQTDGNLVVYTGQNKPLWASGTNGKPAASVVMQNDGNLVIYDSGNHPLWASNTVVPTQPAKATHGDRLTPGQGLMPGSSIASANGRFSFIMQNDGNLVLYGPGHAPLWASNTSGHHNIWDLIFQTDGNLVVYDSHNHPLWATGTNGKPAASFVVQNDGNLVVYNSHSHPLWASGTNGKPAASLVVQSDGNVVIYDAVNHPLWATNTNS